MTEARAATERAVKRMRRLARVLAVFWASSGTFVIVATLVADPLGEALIGFPDYMKPFHLDVWLGRTPLEFWLKVGFLILVLWVTTAIAWRWERIGGVFLLLASLLLLSAARPVTTEAGAVRYVVCLPCSLPAALPGVVAAFLLLASWRKSRASKGPEDTKRTQGEGV